MFWSGHSKYRVYHVKPLPPFFDKTLGFFLFFCECMGGRTGSGGGLLLFGYVCLGEPQIRYLFFFFIFRKNSKSVKLLEIRRILRVFPSEAQSTYKIVSKCLILLGKFWLVLTAKKYFFISLTIKRNLKLHKNRLNFAGFSDFVHLKL